MTGQPGESVAQRWPSVILLALLASCTNVPPKPTTSCVDFHAYKDHQQIREKLTIDRFTFDGGRDQPLEVRDGGGAGSLKGLQITDHLYVSLDEPFTLFEVTYISNSAQPIRFETYAQDAAILESRTFAAEPQQTPLVQPLQEAKATKLLGFYDGGGAALLTKVCVTH
jgi:hypothetical protein